MSEPEISKSAIHATATSAETPTADGDGKGTSYTFAANGNVMENGLQRGLKSREFCLYAMLYSSGQKKVS
jgi:hypothetical protein